MLQAFRNSFRSRKYFKKKQQKLGYLPVQTVQEGENFESPAMTPNLSLESRDFQGSITEESLSSKLGHETSHGSLDSRTEEDEHCLIGRHFLPVLWIWNDLFLIQLVQIWILTKLIFKHIWKLEENTLFVRFLYQLSAIFYFTLHSYNSPESSGLKLEIKF